MGNVRINTSIGTILKVFPQKITVEVNDPSQLSYIHQGAFYELEGINHYITIHRNEDEKFIYNVIGIYVNEKPLLEAEESKFKEKIMIDAIPVGELYFGKFTFGVARTPMVGNDVFLTTNKDFDKALGANQNDGLTFQIGPLSNDGGLMPDLNVDELFSNHTCILGNTGSGKSTSVRKLISELNFMIEKGVINPQNVNFFVFDLHDEYPEYIAEGNIKELSIKNDLAVDIQNLVLEDWLNLVQPGEQIQKPVLTKALKLSRIIENDIDEEKEVKWLSAYIALNLYKNVQTDSSAKRTKIVNLLSNIDDDDIKSALSNYNAQFGTIGGNKEANYNEEVFIDSIKKYIKKEKMEFSQVSNYLDERLSKSEVGFENIKTLQQGLNYSILLEEMKGNNQVRSHCATLETRVENIIQEYGRNILSNNSERVSNLVEQLNQTEKPFTIMKADGLEDEPLLFFAGYVLRRVFDNQVNNRESDLDEIYNFIFDEAHNYIKEDEFSKEVSTKIFEKVSKEGRKFGVYLTIASQRPGELSKTVLSQCNNFLLHRIVSNIDLDQMRRSIPYLSDYQLERLSYIRTGTVLMVGEFVPFPLEVNVFGDDVAEASETIGPNKMWLQD